MPPDKFVHPHDTALSAGLRFLAELIAWVAGPWAAAQASRWLVVPVVVGLLVLPGVFSTPNDKRNVVVPTPGPIRILIELALFSVAAAAPWLVWPTPVAAACVAIVVLALLTGATRLRWLWHGAPI